MALSKEPPGKEQRKDSSFDVLMVDINSLNAAPYNPRREMTEQEKESLRKSLKSFGFVQPLVVQKSGMVLIGGHQRWEIAKEQGLLKVPVFIVDVPDDEAKSMNLALNKISSDFDETKLRDMLIELTGKPIDLSVTGFSAEELLKFTEPPNTQGMEEMDLSPPPKMVWLLIGVPLNKYGEVQKHVAALEQHSEVVFQSTNSNEEPLRSGKKA